MGGDQVDIDDAPRVLDTNDSLQANDFVTFYDQWDQLKTSKGNVLLVL